MAKILVVDDIDYLRKSLVTILNHEGHKVMEAPNGKEAEIIIRSNPPDILIVDVVMPEKGGVELLIDLKKELRSIKTIVMSGRVTGETEAFNNLITQYGARHFLLKPFHKKELLAAVNDLL